MSLFPAYTSGTGTSQENGSGGDGRAVPLENTSNSPDLTWLKNTSYVASSVDPKFEESQRNEVREEKSTVISEIDNGNSKFDVKKKKKKDKKKKFSRHNLKKTETFSSTKIFDSDQFYEDRKQEKGNFLVDTLHRPAIPRYNKFNHYFKRYRYLESKYKGKKIKRYFIIRSSKNEKNPEHKNDTILSKEEELTKVTEDFNKRLFANPNDVEVWLEYVRFQDTMYEFEKAYRKNPMGGDRVTSERKLAILERAIQSNPVSERLLLERLELWESVRPADQLAEECTQALVQDPGNLALWRTLVRTTRNTMARCTAPGVTQIFTKAITRVGQLRLYRPAVSVEQSILCLLIECGLFMQQAGLWEQLWTLLQMYLSLSLTATGQLNIPVQLEEDKLKEQEDSVVASGLPLSVLWLRVEKLRAACHFLPDTACDSDPQRVVFSDDVSGLLQPVLSVELQLRLVVSVAVLLKVPLLPTRHCLMLSLGLLDIPSAVSNVETLLAALHSSGISTQSDGQYLSGAADLLCEPQYVREQLGQWQYLRWVVAMLQHCADLLPPADSLLIHSWTLRLYGLLCRLHTLGLGLVPSTVAKQSRQHAKQLLKSPQFRENLLLYTEYALLERDAGDLAKACKVLETAAASPFTAKDEPDIHRTVMCRRLVECLLVKDPVSEKEHAVRILVSLGDQKPVTTSPVSEVAIKRSIAKWQQQTSHLIDRYTAVAGEPLTVAGAMTPHLVVEWLACHALILHLTHSVWDATVLVQKHIDLIPHEHNTLGCVWVEQLHEVLVDTLYTHTVNSKTSYTLLRNALVKALTCFPNNINLLHTLATIETRSGGGGTPMWKLVSFFPTSSPLARLVLVFVVRCRISSQRTESTSNYNYLTNLLRQLTQERVTRQCPLMWRLYLQLVAATGTTSQVKAVFYQCLQECPWVKAFYLDAVKFLPEELPEIQDLLIEKELRLHTAPEELDILRN